MTDTIVLRDDLLELTTEIVSVFVKHNAVSLLDLPSLVRDVHASLATLGHESVTEPAIVQAPAVPIKKSVTPDFIVCLEDGKKFKSLKRHLMTHFQMTPDDYRAKWNLPSDYPMVAPSYAAVRSNLAKTNGLGRRPAFVAAQARRKKVAADV
ncbi:putative transcriptional regulator [Devosia sp. UYZn731]|uniref:MucR family transcriptional regulator n=1 Tax=Devosia sp. UYZn731 TaxID=3156345 RepID=UPI003390A5A1